MHLKFTKTFAAKKVFTLSTSSALTTYWQEPSGEIERNEEYLPQGKRLAGRLSATGVFLWRIHNVSTPLNRKDSVALSAVTGFVSQLCIDVNLLRKGKSCYWCLNKGVLSTFSNYENLRIHQIVVDGVVLILLGSSKQRHIRARYCEKKKEKIPKPKRACHKISPSGYFG